MKCRLFSLLLLFAVCLTAPLTAHASWSEGPYVAEIIRADYGNGKYRNSFAYNYAYYGKLVSGAFIDGECDANGNIAFGHARAEARLSRDYVWSDPDPNNVDPTFGFTVRDECGWHISSSINYGPHGGDIYGGASANNLPYGEHSEINYFTYEPSAPNCTLSIYNSCYAQIDVLDEGSVSASADINREFHLWSQPF